MSKNSMILAKMGAIMALRKAKIGPQPAPFAQLMTAVEDAIADGRQRRDDLAADGLAVTQKYLQLNAQIVRWEAARNTNR
jgi:hypothetical protein